MNEFSRKKIFGIHGGGCIGLGLMADIVAKSPENFQILATSNKGFFSQLINSSEKFWLQHGNTLNADTTCVSGIQIISRNKPDIIRLYQQAHIVALCVTPIVFKNIVDDMAYGLIARYECNNESLKILVLMNITKCDEFVRQYVFEALISITQNKYKAFEILSKITFVPTVVDRIVTPITIDKVKKQIHSQLLRIPEKTYIENNLIDKNKPFEKNISQLMHHTEKLIKVVRAFNIKYHLYNAEKHFFMYVPNTFSEAAFFPHMTTKHNLSQMEQLKNKYINAPHAILAWAGALNGCKTIAEAIAKPSIHQFIKNVMTQEIRPILQSECPNISHQELTYVENKFFERCAASVDDPVTRVGRDPLRKLDVDGNIRGSIELVKKHKLPISTQNLEKGIALGILYALDGIDPENLECRKIMDIYKKFHSYAAILCHCKNFHIRNYTNLRANADKKFINSIIDKIYHLRFARKNKSFSKAILN